MVESTSELHYFHTNPVRGQLEPYDESTATRAGWRFLQCTDIRDELKVLLPPMTASLYAQLLKTELSELAKVETASWGRILEIRRLKDRMIKKCRKHSQSWASGSTGPSHFVAAPPGFRVREMEKWLSQQLTVEDTAIYHVHEVSTRHSTYYDNGQCRPLPSSRRKTSHTSRGPLYPSSVHINAPTPPSQGSRRRSIQPVSRSRHGPNHQLLPKGLERTHSHRDNVSRRQLTPIDQKSNARHKEPVSEDYSHLPSRASPSTTRPSLPADDFRQSRPVSPTKSNSRSLELVVNSTSGGDLSRDATEHTENDLGGILLRRPSSPPPLPHLFRPSIPQICVNGVPIRDDDICTSPASPLSEGQRRTQPPQMVQSVVAAENTVGPQLQRKSSVKRYSRDSTGPGKTVRWIEDLDCEELRALCQKHQGELRKCIDDLNAVWKKLGPSMEELKQSERVASEAEGRLRFVIGQLERKERSALSGGPLNSETVSRLRLTN